MATIDSFESLAQLEDCLGPSAVVTSAVPLMAAYARRRQDAGNGHRGASGVVGRLGVSRGDR